MPIRDPEIASAYGALDSDAFVDGAPQSAHVLRTMAMNRNRLVAKGQGLFNLIWPVYDTTEVNGGVFAGFAPLSWTRITVPIAVEKRPGLNLANVRMRVEVSSGHTLQFQVTTRALTFRRNAGNTDPNVVEVLGTGSRVNVDLDDIPMRRDAREYFELWVRGIATGTAGATGTHGTPNAGSIESHNERQIADTGALWNRTGSGSLSWAEGGHYVEIHDPSGNLVVPGREIIAVTGGPAGAATAQALIVARPYSVAEVARTSGAGNYAIFKLPEWSIANFMAYAQPRVI